MKALTVMVDWSLKINYLSIYESSLTARSVGVNNSEWPNRHFATMQSEWVPHINQREQLSLYLVRTMYTDTDYFIISSLRN